MSSGPQEYVPASKEADDSDIYFTQLDEDEQEALLVSLESKESSDRRHMLTEIIAIFSHSLFWTGVPLAYAFLIALHTRLLLNAKWFTFWFPSVIGCLSAEYYSRKLRSRTRDYMNLLVKFGSQRASFAQPHEWVERPERAATRKDS
jgi:hypothetical protein